MGWIVNVMLLAFAGFAKIFLLTSGIQQHTVFYELMVEISKVFMVYFLYSMYLSTRTKRSAFDSSRFGYSVY